MDPPVLVALVAAAATWLADPVALVVIVTLLYWLAPPFAADQRSVGGTMVGLAIGALAVTVGAKAAFGAPRPPGASTVAFGGLAGSFVRAAISADGFGFPSGHAVAATVVYGGFAAFTDLWRRRTRVIVAGCLVCVVAATRVILGVHYVIDVLAGIALGFGTLVAFVRVARRGFRPRPDRALFLAGSLGVVAVLVAAGSGQPDSVVRAGVAAGGGFGGYLVWRLRGPDDTPVGVGWSLVGLGVVAGAFGYATRVAEDGVPTVVGLLPETVWLRFVVATTVAAVGVAALIGWPTVRRVVGERI